MRAGLLLLLLAGSAAAQGLYRYQGPDGEWIYADRPPPGATEVEVRPLERRGARQSLKVESRVVDTSVELYAVNNYHAPVQLQVRLTDIDGLVYSEQDMQATWVVGARGEYSLLTLPMNEVEPPALAYEYQYLIGDPDARHAPARPYRVPYAVASDHPVSQAWPDAITHATADTQFAVDFAMPIGTDIVAARGGVVVEIEGGSWRGGTNRAQNLDQANYVTILHDDGTYAMYAHLDWNAIRVRPGDRVERGQPIARSGNTGFSTGPHLHFAVLKNAGMALESVNVRFEGQGGAAVSAQTGRRLRAY